MTSNLLTRKLVLKLETEGKNGESIIVERVAFARKEDIDLLAAFNVGTSATK